MNRTLSTIRDLCITEKQLSATLIKSENLIVYEDRTNATEFLATSRAATGQEVSTVEDAENSETDIREHHPINIAIHPRHIKQKANLAQAMKRDWFILLVSLHTGMSNLVWLRVFLLLPETLLDLQVNQVAKGFCICLKCSSTPTKQVHHPCYYYMIS